MRLSDIIEIGNITSLQSTSHYGAMLRDKIIDVFGCVETENDVRTTRTWIQDDDVTNLCVRLTVLRDKTTAPNFEYVIRVEASVLFNPDNFQGAELLKHLTLQRGYLAAFTHPLRNWITENITQNV